MTNILVVGLGDTGGPLAAHLAREGHQVWGLRRSDLRPPDGVKLIRADLSQPQTLRDLPAVEQVFYVVSASTYDEAGYRAAYVTGLANLLDALKGQAVQRMIHVSSTSVYGQSDGQTVDETSPTQPPSYRGRIMLEGEALLQTAPGPATSVRLAGIYGPGRFYLLNAVAKGARWPPHIIGNRIHRDDCIGVLAFLAARPQLAPVYLACDDAPVPMTEVAAWLRERLRENGVTIGTDPAIRAMHGAKRCNNARLKALGYRFKYPDYRAGYQSLIQDWLTARNGER